MKTAEESVLLIRPPAQAPFLGGLMVQLGKCPYYADKRPTQTAFTLPRSLNGCEYQRAMDIGMRRSGTLVYRPICPNCRKCLALRTRVSDFKPSRSQYRVLKKCENHFTLTVAKPSFSVEKFLLYQHYVAAQHGQVTQENEEENYRRFLVETNVDTIEVTWRDREQRLVAVGILDVTSVALSSVYFFWDVSLKSYSLGVYSVLREIDIARQMGLPYYYLGYLVPGVHSMDYKSNFSATEVWDGQTWRDLPSRDMKDPLMWQALRTAELGAAAVDSVNFDVAGGIEITLK